MNLNEFKKCLNDVSSDDLRKLEEIIESKSSILILGNGGSNAISSHIAQDYTKFLGIKAQSFSDAARLTCYINDYGMESAYQKFVEHFAEPETLVILISSSGNSANIVNACKYCIDQNLEFITLSGFKKDNQLNQLSETAQLNFWVESEDYGVVESLHQIILHTVI